MLPSFHRELRQRDFDLLPVSYTAANLGRVASSQSSHASYNSVQLVIRLLTGYTHWPVAQEEHHFNGQTSAPRVPKFL